MKWNGVKWIMVDPEGFERFKSDLMTVLEPLLGADNTDETRDSAGKVIAGQISKMIKGGVMLPAFPTPRDGGLTVEEIAQVHACLSALYGDQFRGFAGHCWDRREFPIAAEDKPDTRPSIVRMIEEADREINEGGDEG